MKLLRYIVCGVLFLLYFLCYRGLLSHIVFYQEQHHLFLFSSMYFRQCVASEGWAGYFTNFFIQFFYYPLLGCALLAFVLTAIYLMTDYILRVLCGREDLFQLGVIPSMLLFLYTMSADHLLTPVVCTFMGLAVGVLLLAVVRRCGGLPVGIVKILSVRLLGKRGRMVLTLFCLVGYGSYGYVRFVTTYNMPEHVMLKAEQAVKAKDWQEVLSYTNRYISHGRSNQLIAYFHNLALFHTGSLPYHLFDYPQMLGVKCLFFPWNSNSRESEYGHFIYEEIGHINEACRWEFEAMVVWGETAPHLLNLARYNIVNHRPLVAQRFLNKLKQSLFYRKEALALEKCIGSGEVPGLRNALSGVQDVPAHFANVLNLGMELQYLCERDTTNQMAFEYLMGYLLLSNSIPRFVDNLKMIRRFAYPQLPPAYEEALYVYRLKVGEEAFAETGFTISAETEKRFQRYYHLVESRQMQLLQKEFGKSFWYYMNYVSPYGNKVISDRVKPN